jgi:hypothetical protein
VWRRWFDEDREWFWWRKRSADDGQSTKLSCEWLRVEQSVVFLR